MRAVLTRGTVVIELERCKGCELCIPACRPGVLSMSEEANAHGFRFPLLSPGCTACRACREVCPDFVFEVYRFDEPQLLEVDDTAPAAAAVPPGKGG
jgi:2-oxoglutarate ferredoxin oxidoreductase subunit delta